jgi:cell division protein FtsN
LKKNGIEAIIVNKVINDKTYYHIQAGAFSEKSKAEKMIKKLKKKRDKGCLFFNGKASSC